MTVNSIDDITKQLYYLLTTLINKFGNGVKLQKKLISIPGMTPFIKSILFESDYHKLRYREFTGYLEISQ